MGAVVDRVDAEAGQPEQGLSQICEWRMPFRALHEHAVARGVEQHRGRWWGGEQFADGLGSLEITLGSSA